MDDKPSLKGRGQGQAWSLVSFDAPNQCYLSNAVTMYAGRINYIKC